MDSAILCLDVTDREIGLAVADSPSSETEVHKLHPLSYYKASLHKDRQQLKETVYDKLDEIVQDNNVGGIVVAWPTLSGGRAGGSCGKVLHLLDYIAGKSFLCSSHGILQSHFYFFFPFSEESITQHTILIVFSIYFFSINSFIDHNGSLLSKNRPFTLWDTHNVHKDSSDSSSSNAYNNNNNDVPPDQWGRSVVFSRVPAASQQGFSSDQQKFHHHTSTKHLSAEKILESFIDSHWANHARRNTTSFHSQSNKAQQELVSTQDSYDMESSLL